ncbi:MAG: NTP transferase domain-containing protein, partial [bacterium]
MKVVILCGGRGTRMEADTATIPKPMVEIGGRPVLWHIMMLFSHYGFHEFVLCLGYRGYLIKEYFSHYFLHMSDVTIDIMKSTMEVHTTASAPWK